MSELRHYLINYEGYEVPQVITKEHYSQSWDKPEHHPDFIRWTGDWIEEFKGENKS